MKESKNQMKSVLDIQVYNKKIVNITYFEGYIYDNIFSKTKINIKILIKEINYEYHFFYYSSYS